jgi:hypothetical protein
MPVQPISVKHSAIFYNTLEELITFLTPYFIAGLKNNELCLWIVPKNMDVSDATLALSETMEGLDHAMRKGQMLILDSRTFYLKDNIFIASDLMEKLAEIEKNATQKGFKGICVCGDGTWASSEYHWLNFLLYERETDKVINSHNIRALCAYCLKELQLKMIAEISLAHHSSLVNRTGEWSALGPNDFKKSVHSLLPF